jgi:2'-5' RNA ligase
MMPTTGQTEISQYRYAVYLIPPYEIARPVSDVHDMLNKQFGFTAASKFQVHATLKGFFKCSKCGVESLISSLDLVFADQEAVPIHIEGFHIDDVGFGLDVSRIGELPNQLLADFRTRIVDAVIPFIADDCDFVESDLGSPFKAHITLAFRDIKPEIRESVLAYIEPAPLPKEPFIADTFHLLEFHSQEWDGKWYESLTWRLLHSWRLGRH